MNVTDYVTKTLYADNEVEKMQDQIVNSAFLAIKT